MSRALSQGSRTQEEIKLLAEEGTAVDASYHLQASRIITIGRAIITWVTGTKVVPNVSCPMAAVRCVMDLFQPPTDRLTQYSVIWSFSQVHQTSDNSHRTADISDRSRV